MATILDKILDLKTQAKNRRDFRMYDRAVPILDNAISLAKDYFDRGQLKSQMAEQLADCYGLLGGVQRRWALESADEEARKSHLRDSIRAYDAAWEFESGDYGVTNSYGMVNRLISRLLLVPDFLFVDGETNFGEGVNALAVRSELQKAGEKIQLDLAGPRQGDYWALADLALVNVLLEKQDGISAYGGFLDKSPPDYAFKSVLDVLRPLSNLNWRLSERLKKLVAYLEARRQVC